MKYNIKLTNTAKKQLEKLDRTTRILISHWIIKNLQGTDNPFEYGKPLKGNYKGQWRYRVGTYRLICEIKDNELIIETLEIGHRGRIYDNK